MAIKVQGTTIIDDSKVLSNISSVDSTTANSISSALTGGTPAPLTVTSVTASSNQTNFPVNYKSGNISVYLNGSRLADSDDYTATSGTAVVLTTGATSNDLVEIVEHGAAFASPYAANIYTANGSSPFNSGNTTLTASYTKGKEAVYVNGVKFLSGTDYTTNNAGDTITFLSALSSGDLVEVVEHGALANSSFTDLTDTPSSLGTAGQVAQINSAGNAIEFADPGTKTVANITELEALTSSEGDMAFVTGTNGLFIKKTAGWYKIATVANEQLHTVTVTMSGGGTAADPYELALDGTDTTATGAATDPEGLSVTWSVAAISPATLSGNNIVVSGVTVATVTQSTNVFTIDPVATTGTHNFSLRFSVTDGINATINTDKNYTLNFVTSIADSNHTIILVEAIGANNGTNDTVTDSHDSSSPHTVTYPGTKISTGTFSPYRAGGYSGLFGSGNYLSSDMTAIGTSNYTIEAWINWSTVTSNSWIFDGRYDGHYGNYLGSGGIGLRVNTSGQVQAFAGTTSYTGTTVLSTDTWYHIMVVRSGTGTNEFKVYLDGSLEVQGTDASSKTGTYVRVGASYAGGNSPTGYIRDLRISTTARSTTTPTAPVEADSDTIWLGCGLPYFADASSSNNSITITGTPATKPFGPYDYSEYRAADNGGSVYFRGAAAGKSDYINVSSSNDFELGTGDFTIEGWLYPLTAVGDSGKPRVFMLKKAASATSIFEIVLNSTGTLRGGSGNLDSTTNFVNSWNHFAFVRNSGTLKLYVNGAEERSASDTTSYSPGSPNPVLGAYYNGTVARYKGYISDFRITKSAVYTSSFDAPTAPLASTNSVLHLKGTDASIIDKSGSATFRLEGNAVSSTTQAKFSNTNSVYFDGSGDYFNLSVNDVTNIKDLPDIGSSDFTLEMWMYETSHDNNAVLMDLRGASGSGAYNLISHSGNIRWLNSGTLVLDSGSSLSTNTWYHVALCRQGSSTRIFIDGSQSGSTYTDTNNYVTGTDRPIFGTNGYNTSVGHYAGYLQDIRLSIGKAHYTGTFSVPTAPHKG